MEIWPRYFLLAVLHSDTYLFFGRRWPRIKANVINSRVVTREEHQYLCITNCRQLLDSIRLKTDAGTKKSKVKKRRIGDRKK